MNETNVVVKDNTVLLTRQFNAKRSLVWQAFTKSDYLEKWWGPDGFTLTTHEFEFAEGGFWKFTMHGPDGQDFPNNVRFLEIKEPETLVYTNVDDQDAESISFRTRVSFRDQGDSTELEMHMVFKTVEMLRMVIEENNALEGGKQTLARLEAFIKSV